MNRMRLQDLPTPNWRVLPRPVCQAFPNTFANSDKVVTTGNPVRAEITAILNPSWRYQTREQSTITTKYFDCWWFTGFSQALNERLPEALKRSMFH